MATRTYFGVLALPAAIRRLSTIGKSSERRPSEISEMLGSKASSASGRIAYSIDRVDSMPSPINLSQPYDTSRSTIGLKI